MLSFSLIALNIKLLYKPKGSAQQTKHRLVNKNDILKSRLYILISIANPSPKNMQGRYLKSLQWFTKQTILFIYLFILTESSPK